MSLGKRIKEERMKLGLSQAQFSVRCGFPSASRISNYESESREPDLSAIKAIAQALNIDAIDLIREEIGMGNINSQAKIQLPVYSWEKIANLPHEKPLKIIERISPARSYALEIDDDSMVNNVEASPTFPKGTLIIVDPDKQFEHNNCVIAKPKNNAQARPIFRLYKTDFIKEYLVPLNVSRFYDPYPAENFDIIGVVVASINLDL